MGLRGRAHGSKLAFCDSSATTNVDGKGWVGDRGTYRGIHSLGEASSLVL